MRIKAVDTLILLLFLSVRHFAQESVIPDDLGLEVKLSSFEAELGIGFNYDLLRDPFDVSFEYPKGYFGLNLPLGKNINVMDYKEQINEGIDSLISKNESKFSNLDEFKPTVGARQNPNPTIRVDVPMIGGVASFSSTQNFFLQYRNVLGNPDILINPLPDSIAEGVSLFMRGTLFAPINLTASWETMTFGYAFEINRYFAMAIHLHRHVFYLDIRGKADADILGYYTIAVGDAAEGSDLSIPSLSDTLDYSSEKMSGSAYGHYEAEVWSPTLALKAWRFTIVSRFGIDTKAKGSFLAKYYLPFFIDPVTMKMKYDLENPDVLNSSEVREGLQNYSADSVIYTSRKETTNGYRESDLEWNMPTGLTLAFDIIPKMAKLSYTKMFGDVAMKLDRIVREQKGTDTIASERALLNDTLVIDYGISIDNILILNITLFNSFLNVGVFGMDFRYADSTNMLSKNFPADFKLGDEALFPILSLGTAFGTKMQLLLELDVLPLPAIKTGINYYF